MSLSWIEKLEALQADLDNGTDGLGALKALMDAIPTTMVGTDNAALASAWTSALATALGNYTSTRAGYIDELASANLPTDVANIKTDTGNIKTQTDKLAGAAPSVGTTTANWNAAEADIVSIGANDTKNKLHSLLISIHNLIGTTITVRMYSQVNGVERKVYEQTFDATSDPPGLWIVNGTIGIHEVLRVSLQSNNATDDAKAVHYDYMLEVM